ncbi:hypothetical protein KM043_002403 [Ampulex compressa]|nr:hypothetical protein KM043_002403 [Ampulex compressa]
MEIRREPIFSSSRRAAVKKSSGSPTLNQKAGAYWQRVDSRSISIAASCNSREPRATSVSRQDVLCHENQTSVWLTKNLHRLADQKSETLHLGAEKEARKHLEGTLQDEHLSWAETSGLWLRIHLAANYETAPRYSGEGGGARTTGRAGGRKSPSVRHLSFLACLTFNPPDISRRNRHLSKGPPFFEGREAPGQWCAREATLQALQNGQAFCSTSRRPGKDDRQSRFIAELEFDEGIQEVDRGLKSIAEVIDASSTIAAS